MQKCQISVFFDMKQFERFERLKGFQQVNPTSKSCARRYQSPSNHPAAARVRAAIGTGRRVREASDPSRFPPVQGWNFSPSECGSNAPRNWVGPAQKTTCNDSPRPKPSASQRPDNVLRIGWGGWGERYGWIKRMSKRWSTQLGMVWEWIRCCDISKKVEICRTKMEVFQAYETDLSQGYHPFLPFISFSFGLPSWLQDPLNLPPFIDRFAKKSGQRSATASTIFTPLLQGSHHAQCRAMSLHVKRTTADLSQSWWTK